MLDEEFKTKVLVTLERIEGNQATHTRNDAEHDERLSALEHTINGNGGVGLAEEVRGLKSRWALLVAGGSLAVSALFSTLFHIVPELGKFFAKKIGG